MGKGSNVYYRNDQILGPSLASVVKSRLVSLIQHLKTCLLDIKHGREILKFTISMKTVLFKTEANAVEFSLRSRPRTYATECAHFYGNSS